MILPTQQSRILEYLQQGQTLEAQALLSVMTPETATDQAVYSTLQAKIYLYNGAYMKALSCLEMALNFNPSDLDALCDLALCHFQLGLMAAFDETLQRATQILKNEMPQLSIQKSLDHAIFLAKLHEERTQLDEASELLRLLSKKQLSVAQEQVLRIQLLRLAVEKRDLKNATALYPLVLRSSDHNLNFEIEREHVLLLADAFLFGFTQAEERFSYIISKDLSRADRDFFLSEMSEVAILANQSNFLKKHPPSLQTENEYEKNQAVLIGAFLSGDKAPALSVIRLEKNLSNTSLLRLLRQALILFPQAPDHSTWGLRYRFHCLQIVSKDLRANFLSALNSTTTKVILDAESKQVVYEGQENSLQSPLFWKLVTVFKDNKSEASLDEVIQVVYDEIPNEQHFDRLRIAISRLNAQLRTSHGIESLFKITKSKVMLLLPMEKSAS